MIVRITITDQDGKDYKMLFGDSYKKWEQQYQEFLWRNIRWYNANVIIECNIFEAKDIYKCDDEWKAWGGLKECREEFFQQQLNREGCQEKDPDNPNPRKYSDMVFMRAYEFDKKIKKMLKASMKKFWGKSRKKIACEVFKNGDKQRLINNRLLDLCNIAQKK